MSRRQRRAKLEAAMQARPKDPEVYVRRRPSWTVPATVRNDLPAWAVSTRDPEPEL